SAPRFIRPAGSGAPAGRVDANGRALLAGIHDAPSREALRPVASDPAFAGDAAALPEVGRRQDAAPRAAGAAPAAGLPAVLRAVRRWRRAVLRPALEGTPRQRRVPPRREHGARRLLRRGARRRRG